MRKHGQTNYYLTYFNLLNFIEAMEDIVNTRLEKITCEDRASYVFLILYSIILCI